MNAVSTETAAIIETDSMTTERSWRPRKKQRIAKRRTEMDRPSLSALR
jgi:hypothetical protein